MIDDLRHFRADNERMRRLAWTLGITAAVMLFVAGSWNLMDAEEAAGEAMALPDSARVQDGNAPKRNAVSYRAASETAGSIPVLAAPSAPINDYGGRSAGVSGGIPMPASNSEEVAGNARLKSPLKPAPAISLSRIISPPEWLCLSQRVQRGRVELRRFAIAHQRESDHEWEIACGYGPAFPRGGV